MRLGFGSGSHWKEVARGLQYEVYASERPGDWSAFLGKLASELNAVVMMGLLPRTPGASAQFSASGISRDQLASFLHDFAGRDPLSLHALTLGAGELSTLGGDHVDIGLERSLFYTDWMKPGGLSRDPVLTCCVTHDSADMPVVLFVMFREGHTPDVEAVGRVLSHLLPHLGRALESSSKLAKSTGILCAWRSFLDTLPAAAFLLDEDLKVLETNREGRRVLRDGDPLRLGAHGLEATTPRTSRHLRRFLEDALDAESLGDRVMVIERSSSEASIELLALPLRSEDLPRAPGAPELTLLVRDRSRAFAPPREVVQALYGLTPAEARLACLLAEGYSVAEAAQAVSITVETARSRLKSVFLKTDTTRQGELIWRVLSGIAPLASRSPACDGTAPDDEEL